MPTSIIPDRKPNGTGASGNGGGPEGFRSWEDASWRDHAIADLTFRYAGCPADSMIMVNTRDAGWKTHRYNIDQIERIADDFAGVVNSRHVYARTSVIKQDTELGTNERGKKEHTYGTAMLEVDVDPDGSEDFDERKLEELRAFDPAPSVIIRSGRGYYVGWKIPFTMDWSRTERITKWLTLQLGSGADTGVWDAAHLYRIAGTYNPKPDANQFARIIEMYPDRVYALDDFGEADLSHEDEELSREDYGEEILPLGFDAQVQAASPKLWKRILSEQTALDAGAQIKDRRGGARVDRSRNDFYIAIELLRLGLTKGQVMTVLTHSQWFSGAKFRQTHSVNYVKRTILNAAKRVTDSPMKKASDIGKHLLEEMALLNHLTFWYRYNPDRGVYEPCEDELLLRIQTLAGEFWTGNLEDNVLRYMRPHVRLDQLPQTELINVKNGMLDWRTGKLMPHSPAYKSIVQYNASWHQDPATVDYADVDAFIGEVLEPEALPIWWGFNGIVLDDRVPQPYRCILALVGLRKTGKSTLLKAIATFVGEENTSSIALDQLGGSGNQFTTSGLIGSRVNLDMDAPYDVRIRENHTLKAISGGDAISLERKHHDKIKAAYLPVKFAFGMNRVPTFGAVDEAFYDRWRVLRTGAGRAPFDRRDGRMKVNAHLRLLSQPKNRDAWLHRSIQGLQQVEKDEGFPGSENRVVREGLTSMRMQGDAVFRFMADRTEEAPEEVYTLAHVHSYYKSMVQAEGGFPLSAMKFRASLEEMQAEGHFPGLRIFHDSRQWKLAGRRLVMGSF